MATITIRADRPGRPISPLLNGVFFEDINFAADGGLYPERIKNGSFEFSPDSLLGWRKIERAGATGQLSIRNQQPLNENNPNYLRLTVETPADGFGLSNEGFHGIGIQRGVKYIFSVYARSADSQSKKLLIELHDQTNQKFAAAKLHGFSPHWEKYSCVIESPVDVEQSHLLILATDVGSIDLDMISLLPEDAPLFRTDLVQLLKDLKPKFLRFPGGCIVEGRLLSNRYQWKKTIGDRSQRQLILNRWNTEFKHRMAPDYFQSFGLGFHEYFLLCEEIGAEPLPIINCGMACQFNSGELAPLDQLDSYINDALDLIEFANGSANSTWGKIRSDLGHPHPFNLKMLGIGNEQWGPSYIERYERFATSIKKKHPDIQLIAAAGPSPDGPDFDFAWQKLRELNADIIDEHYYRPPEWFPANAGRYDTYDRKGPKVFAGEFAAQSVGTCDPSNRNNWNCALAEAAFMTGLERNADIVQMACYAPLFAHIDRWQWTPNLIWFNNLRAFGTPSYYVQKLFSHHCGSATLQVETTGDSTGLFTCASRDDASGDLILKLVNILPQPKNISLSWPGLPQPAEGESYLIAAQPTAENNLEFPVSVSPFKSLLRHIETDSNHFLPPYSLTVLRVRKKCEIA